MSTAAARCKSKKELRLELSVSKDTFNARLISRGILEAIPNWKTLRVLDPGQVALATRLLSVLPTTPN